MVDLEPFTAWTDGAPTVLTGVERCDVGQREATASGGFSRSSDRAANSTFDADVIRVCGLPSCQHRANLLSILGAVSFVYLRLLVRMLLSVFALVLSLVSRAIIVPFAGAPDGALYAMAICHESLVVSLRAWLAAVVALAGGACRNSIRVFWRPAVAQEAKCFLAIADDAVSGSRPAIRKMAVPTRLACVVGALTRGDSGSALRYGSHGFTVMQPLMKG